MRTISCLVALALSATALAERAHPDTAPLFREPEPAAPQTVLASVPALSAPAGKTTGDSAGSFNYSAPGSSSATVASTENPDYGKVDQAAGVSKFTDPNALAIGPQEAFLDAKGKPIKNSQLREGMDVTMETPAGAMIECTIEINGGKQTAREVRNNHNDEISWADATGDREERGVVACTPKNQAEATMKRLGVKQLGDLAYYYGTATQNQTLRTLGLAATVGKILLKLPMNPDGTVKDDVRATMFGGGGK